MHIRFLRALLTACFGMVSAAAAPVGAAEPKSGAGTPPAAIANGNDEAAGDKAGILRVVPKPTPQWPLTASDLKDRAPNTEHVSPIPADVWSKEDRVVAQARCTALLKGMQADFTRIEPIKEGECGSPAPLEVRSIGRSPAVVLSPPAIMSCDMLAAVATWLRADVQPQARAMMGAAVIKIEVMSSYSCRNAYGRAKTRLSEHGRANALDIRGFVTASGKDAEVLADWGPTRREIVMAAAVETAAARKVAPAGALSPGTGATSPPPPVAKPARIVPAGEATGSGAAVASMAAGVARAAQEAAAVAADGLRASVGPGGAIGLVTGGDEDYERDAAKAGRLWSFSPPNRLGGPNKAKSAPALPVNGDQQFLRNVHEAACRSFGTVLGPEANNAHRNHFHLDMAERTSGNYCR